MQSNLVNVREKKYITTKSFSKVPQINLFETEQGSHLFVVNGSRIYRICKASAMEFEELIDGDDEDGIDTLLTKYDLKTPPYIKDDGIELFPLRALSLAVARKCNLGCVYCYAPEENFIGSSQNMSLDTALSIVERLFLEARPGEYVNLAFMGGEPLMNRNVIYRTTEFASQKASDKNINIGFSITTNGTKVTPKDGEFFEHYGFAVTISIDGIGAAHDRLRPFKDERGSYRRTIDRVKPLLVIQKKMQVSVRVTVTPENLSLRETLDELIDMGFHSVGFSAMLSSPSRLKQMDTSGLEIMLEQMKDCGQQFEKQVTARKRYPFFNMVSALKELHKGTHRPYPCGAGAGYLGVSADGELFACHRFVNDEEGSMGNIKSGVDKEKQSAWLSRWHVHFQEPCKSCWARYLCGGSCYYEVIKRGRPACDYIRGWLHYCLQAYVRLLEKRPDFF